MLLYVPVKSEVVRTKTSSTSVSEGFSPSPILMYPPKITGNPVAMVEDRSAEASVLG